eukprot:Seg1092.2 transcript_id=Seg1092.2/GoldUCD/mRNA.D3Y31 product="hypothetical protein" protein_id=Seg1092.2/GoldUCD/D3Y31
MKLQDLAAELKNNAPFTYSALGAILKRFLKEENTKESRIRIAVAFSILINRRNINMNSIQKLMGILLFKAKARVKIYKRLQYLGLTVSHHTVLRVISEMCKTFDEDVKLWKSKLEEQDAKTQLVETKTVHMDHGYDVPAATKHDHVVDQSAEDEETENIQNKTDGMEEILTPGYQICFDNLNLQRHARNKTSINKNERYDMVQAIAVQDRVNVENYADDDRNFTLRTAKPQMWMLTKIEYEKLRKTLQELVKRIICKQMKFFQDNFDHLVSPHIPHKFQREMKQKSNVVPLGIMLKNEMYTEEMIAVLEKLQEYCPQTKNGDLKKILCGGDGLTTKRGVDAQRARADAPTPEKRLEGLIMKSEDWHEAILCLQIMYDDLYDGKSVGETGTLYQLKQRFDRRNVKKMSRVQRMHVGTLSIL